MPYYAVTVKENSIPYEKLTESLYLDWFRNASLYGLHCTKITFEFDKEWRLHAHAICNHSSKNLFKKKYLYNQFHSNIQLLKSQDDVVQWMSYMYKTYDYETEKRMLCSIIEHKGIQMYESKQHANDCLTSPVGGEAQPSGVRANAR